MPVGEATEWLSADYYGKTLVTLWSMGCDEPLEVRIVLDGVTVQDGWWHSFYYYSPEPHQTYVLWSAGPNGRTFPPWMEPSSSSDRKLVNDWIADDIKVGDK